MSLITLAEQLDILAAQSKTHINEDNELVVASNLSAVPALNILNLCQNLGWDCLVYDEENAQTDKINIIDTFEPFKAIIRKPETIGNYLDILTFSGFSDYLEKGNDATCWRIAGIKKPLITQARTYTNWSFSDAATVSPKTKSPRTLVKNSGTYQNLPTDIRPWLVIDIHQIDFKDPFHKFWCMKALDALIPSLATEVDSESSSIIFKGPPKLVLLSSNTTEELIDHFGESSFLDLQTGAMWAYENSREAELKHNLLSMEIARSGRESGPALEYFKANFSTALESAKIAYQMSLSELGKDTLKSLGELRKAITEETAKATDATRQTITAVSGALTVCIGLIAARLTAHINPWFISAVTLVAITYIGMIVYSGWSFISLQRELRKDWQPKLYRFLPQSEYRKMVSIPAEKAESVFKWSASIGTIAVIFLGIGISVFSFITEPKIVPLEIIRTNEPTTIKNHTLTIKEETEQLKTHPLVQRNIEPKKIWFTPLKLPTKTISMPSRNDLTPPSPD